MTQTCPTASELHGLIGGLFSDADAQSMELHIERCEACQHTIQELAADGTFWQLAVKNLSGDRIAGPGLDRVVEALQGQSREDAQEIGEAIELKLSFIEPPVEPGTIGRLRHYDILRVAGRGGMGIVLRAFDRSLRRIVAIKLLAPHLAGNGQARQRFLREGRAAAAVSHEHVVTIHAVEESPPFLVMQYVPGETLEERIHRTGSLDVREAVRIALQITQGLAAAHAQGVVHRDIKPANILLENGVARVRITDFGLARAIDDASLTQSGVVAGTPQYMAPEQASGDSIDERADLFSLGSVLYTMLAGHAPFRATTAMGVLRRLCDNPARPIREINPETPDWLVVLINRLHAKRPADRFHSATEVAGLLERGLAAMQTGTAMPSAFAPSEPAMASGRASAPGENAMPAGFSPDENPSTQNVSAERESTELHTAHRHQQSFIFTDLGAVAQRLLSLCPLWLLFACVGLAVTPFVQEAGVLSGAFAVIALLAPRVFPRLTSKLLNGSVHARAGSETASVNPVESTRGRSFISRWLARLSAWSLLVTPPALVSASIHYRYEDPMMPRSPHELSAVNDELLRITAVVLVAWLVIAFCWFRQKSNCGSPLFSSAIRRKGMLTAAGLAAICAACGYSTWHSNAFRYRFQQLVDADRRRSISIEPVRQPYCRVQIDFEEPTKGIMVFIDDGSRDLAWAPVGNSVQQEFPASPGKFPWRATLGQSTFAAGEVTLEAGGLAVIRVPRPKLIDLISGRWKSEAKFGRVDGSSPDMETRNMEWEFHEGTAILAIRTPGSSRRDDMTIQIDDSVSPALITLVRGSGEKIEGIIRFIPRDHDQQSEFPSQEMTDPMLSMMGGVVSQHVPARDRLQICFSAPGRLRPWRFEADAEQSVDLYELIRSDDPESLRSSLALEPLPNEATALLVRESAVAWSKHLSIPSERRNSIGLDLTLIPPSNVDLPSELVLIEALLLMPEGTKVVDVNSREPEQKRLVSYPFVISRDVITMAQFQQFVTDTGYVTDAERCEPPANNPLANEPSATETSPPAENAPGAAGSGNQPAEAAADTLPTPGTTGGRVRENDGSVPPTAAGSDRPDGRFIWRDGLSWKTPTAAAAGHSEFSPDPEGPLPVVMVSDNDAAAFCEWLSAKENRQYRLPTDLEWTAAMQLGVMHRPVEGEDPGEKRRWFDAGQPHPLGVRVSARIAGEWTSSTHRSQARQSIRPKKLTVIVKKDLSSDGSRFDLSHQLFASPTFRSSEISFRVVAELQALTTRDEDSPGLR